MENFDSISHLSPIDDSVSNINTNTNSNSNFYKELDESLADHTHPRKTARTVPNDEAINSKVEASNVNSRRNTGTRLETKPTVDEQDNLWTEIDALDDVKRIAEETNFFDGFSPQLEGQLQKIRESHIKLLQTMRERNTKLEEKQRREANVQQTKDIDRTVEEMAISPMSSINTYKDTISKLISRTRTKDRDSVKLTKTATDKTEDLASGNVVSHTNTNSGNNNKFSEYSSGNNEEMGIFEEDKYIQEMVNIIKDLRA
ncbi:hypothetical protein Kpol_1024p41 [Vanderwaltozyma polyspora DSM 70294]|uniref:Uncharacterized protein n=1 Tax=Vanderwaltozyma polyspora (strain ATCC 22028 / DSM 70294 / BCRC 21397 / CBS 2163 / NBRC 10782 / NRRL Y-8283 / UCD 57-17) TaxID=436907 RepID=A7TLK1_VANPO|nr:uncharacterized protein Kpol_1024p41 [Vanderwaltozyma polyspora DSM 70294]EDO16887.1 hypothetical protein Kpol_1024p41 [Vanderwaltozyma polyspora DSM 70294]